MWDNISVYKVGDNAVYPSHGLVKIVAIEKKLIGDQELSFLILQVVESDITVMIPEGSVQARGLRPIAKKNELKIFGKGMIDTKHKIVRVPNLGDHRICMSSFILAILTGSKTEIKNFDP